MDGSSSSRVLSLFVCFAPQDQAWYWRLDKHLSFLKEQGWVTSWSDELMQAGIEREDTVTRQRQNADLFLLLVYFHLTH